MRDVYGLCPVLDIVCSNRDDFNTSSAQFTFLIETQYLSKALYIWVLPSILKSSLIPLAPMANHVWGFELCFDLFYAGMIFEPLHNSLDKQLHGDGMKYKSTYDSVEIICSHIATVNTGRWNKPWDIICVVSFIWTGWSNRLCYLVSIFNSSGACQWRKVF